MGFRSALMGMIGAAPSPVPARIEPLLPAKSVGGSGIGFAGSPGLFYGLGLYPSSTGQPVTPYSALMCATVYACVKRLSEDVGKLPLLVRRRLRTGGYRVDLDHPLSRLFRRPNRWQTPSQCWSYLVSGLALRGNGFAPVIRGAAGEPVEILPVNPDRVGVLLTATGEPVYQVSHPIFRDGVARLHADNVLHARGMSFDGIMGVSPITTGQDVVGLALATQQHGATLFRQGAQINGIIKHPGKMSPEGKDYLSARWEARFGGVQNAHRTPVLDENMSFEKVSMTNEDSQFLGTRQHSVVEICRMFGVPPHKVFDLSNSHFNNVEQGEQQYVNDTLLPICQQVEQQLERVLFFEDEFGDLEIRFNFDALLRADRKTRYETYAIGIGNGVLNRNEARIDDGREPVEGLDQYVLALNMGKVGGDSAQQPPAAVKPADQGREPAEEGT